MMIVLAQLVGALCGMVVATFVFSPPDEPRKGASILALAAGVGAIIFGEILLWSQIGVVLANCVHQ